MTAGRQRLGQYGESKVARWYAERGWEVLDRNWRCPHGEIDLVVRRGDTVAIVEVKTRSSSRFGSPAEAVTPAKQRRLRQLAVRYLRDTGNRSSNVRLDVAEVFRGQVDVIENAF